MCKNSLCVHVLRSPILAALLHGTPAAGSAKHCGIELRAQPLFAAKAAITLGIGPHFSSFLHFKSYIMQQSMLL